MLILLLYIKLLKGSYEITFDPRLLENEASRTSRTRVLLYSMNVRLCNLRNSELNYFKLEA